MPLQGIAASFQLACQDNHKTSMVTDKKVGHCHQTKEHKQSKEPQNFNTSHHCLSFCAQVGMSALTHNIDLALRQELYGFYFNTDVAEKALSEVEYLKKPSDASNTSNANIDL